MQEFDTLAICLKNSPYREADSIVAFYSAEHGEIRAIAKGIKKASSKLAGAVEPLTLNRVSFQHGRNLHQVRHYERVESFAGLRTNLERLATASVCTDVVRLLGRAGDADSAAIYSLLAKTLFELNLPDQPWIIPTLLFHQTLLRMAGYLPDWEHCVMCQIAMAPEDHVFYPFYVDLGGLACPGCALMLNAAKAVNISSKTISLLLNPEDEAFQSQTVKALRFLAFYWKIRLERDVPSFEFLFELLAHPDTSSLPNSTPPAKAPTELSNA